MYYAGTDLEGLRKPTLKLVRIADIPLLAVSLKNYSVIKVVSIRLYHLLNSSFLYFLRF
jgi:hypothetical protein